MNKDQNKGKLFLIPNIIAEGTEKMVIPRRVLEVLPRINYFLVENIRSARRYISSLNLGLSIDQLDFNILNKDTSYADLSDLMKPLTVNGENLGILSESGCPGIADPGSMAVSYAHQKGIDVVPLTGPSSIFLALMASGFNGQHFKFHGYLPINSGERMKAIRELEKESAKYKQTQIFIETPYRNDSLLVDLLKACHPSTKLCIGTGISGDQERVISRTIGDWIKRKPAIGKIPTVFLLYVS